MESFFTHFAPALQSFGAWGYVVMFFVAFLESIVFTGYFFPGAILSVFMGGLAAHGFYNFWILVLLTFVATSLGDAISYELGRRNHHLLDKWPRFKKPIEYTKSFFHKHHRTGVFLGRFFGGTRPIMPFVAGMTSMSRGRFYVADIIACFLWSYFHLGLGYVFGAAWRAALMWSTRAVLFLIIVALLIAAFLWLWRWIIGRGRPVVQAVISYCRRFGDAVLKSSFGKRYPRFVLWLVNRFELNEFTGLPLTVLLTTIVLTGITLAAVAEDVITGDPITIMDIHIVTLAYLVRTRALLMVCYGLSLLVTTRMLITTALVFSLALLLQKRRTDLVTLLIALSSGAMIVFLSKLVFHRDRPSGLLPAVSMSTYSFPSGHATISMVFYGFMAYLVLRSRVSWGLKVSAVMVAFGITILISASRIFLGLHYPSDVLAGMLLGFAVLLTTISISEWLHNKQKTQSFDRVIPTLLLVLGFQALLACVLIRVTPPVWKASVIPVEQQLETQDPVSLLQTGKLPRTSETLLGRKQFPINVLILTPDMCLFPSFTQAGLTGTDQYTVNGLKDIFGAAFMQQSFPKGLVSPSFYLNQPQDISMSVRTATGVTLQLRLWRTQYAVDDQRLFAGAATIQTQGRLFFRRRTTNADSGLLNLIAVFDNSLQKITTRTVSLPALSEGKRNPRLVPTKGNVTVITIPTCQMIGQGMPPPPPSKKPGLPPVPPQAL